MVLSHLALLCQKNIKTNLRSWKKLFTEVLLSTLLCLALWYVITVGAPTDEPQAKDKSRKTTRYDGPELLGYEPRMGVRWRSADTLKWKCYHPRASPECSNIRTNITDLCAEFACFAHDMEFNTGRYIQLSQFDDSTINATITSTEMFLPDPTFKFGSEEFERSVDLPFDSTLLRRFYATLLQRKARDHNFTGDVFIRYLKSGEYSLTSDSVLFNTAKASSRNIVYKIILFMPIVPCLNMATAIGDERRTHIKKYLLTMGISRSTYLLHHVITAFLKNFYFYIVSAFIIFSPNMSFFLLFSLTYCLYLIACLCLSILVTVFLHNPKLIPDVLLVVIPLVLMMPIVFTVSTTRVLLSAVASVNPGYALFNALDALRECSLKGGHLSWFSDFPFVMPFGVTLLLQIFSTMIIISLAVFFDYLVSTSFNPMKFVEKYGKVNVDDDERDLLNLHEDDETPNKSLTIDIKDVHKTYTSGERAVRGANLEIYQGQNTILLGQNGAGKSTLFDIITGSTLPTSGSVRIEWPVSAEKGGLERIGLCPQYSPIFPKLTVIEHLHFFATIGAEKEWMEKANEFTELLSLKEYTHVYAGKLSGGNRRKLCIAMALIGKSDVILMDEPSAGVDTESRAIIKKFLNEQRGSKTLLIATHYTDEAEDMGDRVCIMAQGKNACSGSTSFLCKELGSGYDLKCVVADRRLLDATAERTLRLAQNYLPSSMKSRHGEEFCISIKNCDNERMLAFAKELDNSKEKIGLKTTGWSTTPLEHAFLRVAEQTGSTVERAKVDRAVIDFLREDRNRATKWRRLLNSLVALLYKRALFEYRNKFYQIFFFVLIAISIYSTSSMSNVVKPSELLDLLKLRECGRIAFVNASELRESFNQMATARGECLVVQDVDDAAEWYRLYHHARPPIIAAIEKKSTDYVIAMAPNREIYEPYVATLLYKSLTEAQYEVVLNFQTRPTAKIDENQMQIMCMIITYMLQTVAIARFVRAYVIEHEKGYAHLQVLTGTPKALYWTGHFIIDFLVFAIFYSYLLLVCYCFDANPGVLTKLLPQNILCFCITIVKIAIVHRMFDSKNTAVSIVSVFLFLSLALLLPLYLIMFNRSTVRRFSLEMSFPLFLDPYVAVIAYEIQAAADGPNIYVILIGQLFVFCGIFFCFESRSLRRAIVRTVYHNRQTDEHYERTAEEPEVDDVEMQPLSEPAKPVDEIVVEARPEGAKNIVLEAHNLKKRYGRTGEYAVKGITLAVEQNECFGLLGHNGAGKTTTFKMLTGQCFADAGEANVSGTDVTKPAHIGYCPQEDALINQLTGMEHLVILAALHGYADPFKVAKSLIECVAMERHCGKVFKSLSGGQKRKLSVCASILAMSRLIVLDEPTTGIDPMVRNDIWSLLRSIRDHTSTAIVLTSHSMTEVEALCSRVAIMRRGLIITHGSPQTLVSNHGDYFKLEFRAPSSDPDEMESLLTTLVEDMLPSATFDRKIMSRYVFKIPRTPMDPMEYSRAFEAALAISIEAGAADFTLCQSNLEDTFLALGEDEKETRRSDNFLMP